VLSINYDVYSLTMANKLKGKITLITGGASPIGKAIAERLGKEGARLALTYDSSPGRAEKVCEELKNAGVEVKLFCADLSKPDVPDKLIKKVIHDFGALDILINNASIFPETLLGEIKENDWDQVFNTNARGPFLLIQSALPWLKKNSGTIVNISDINAAKPRLNMRIPYCASKAALDSITKALAKALAPEIRVNAVAPGAIVFPENYSEEQKNRILEEIPLKRQGHTNDIAEAVAFLLIDAPYITGQILSVDGGRSM